jgi:hypothetical protein
MTRNKLFIFYLPPRLVGADEPEEPPPRGEVLEPEDPELRVVPSNVPEPVERELELVPDPILDRPVEPVVELFPVDLELFAALLLLLTELELTDLSVPDKVVPAEIFLVFLTVEEVMPVVVFLPELSPLIVFRELVESSVEFRALELLFFESPRTVFEPLLLGLFTPERNDLGP